MSESNNQPDNKSNTETMPEPNSNELNLNTPSTTTSPTSIPLSFDHSSTVNTVILSDLYFPPPFSDPTGQIQPPAPHQGGNKFAVQATLWKDYGTLCFHVRHHPSNVNIIRREDNHMVNLTSILAAAGWDEMRRENFLGMEKELGVVHVVQGEREEGFDGVWVPFDRALDVANSVGITERLWPLFVHNIAALLYHQPAPSWPPAC